MSSNRARWLRLVPRPPRPGRALALLAAGTVVGVGLAAVQMGATPALAAPTTVTFTFTGAAQSFTVPAGITSLTVDAFGAQGGHGAPQAVAGAGPVGVGGLGGRATANLAVTPGQVLQVNVGGAGGDSPSFTTPGVGGFGGGASSDQAGGGGGGASDVRSGGFTLGERLLVAGAGGGGAGGGNVASAAGGGGGGGGGTSGGAGANGAPGGDGIVPGGGGGGTASIGGSGGVNASDPFSDGQPGAAGVGGTGDGAGGGGWFGGGGGAATVSADGSGGGGGGGSGFGPTGTVFATSVRVGNGLVTITYPALTTPAVIGISPTSGPTSGGTSVTITGTNLTGATAVSFGSTAATSFTVVNDTTITATAPAASTIGTVDVTVTTPAGTSATSSADQYTYVYPFVGFLSPVDNPPTVNMVHAGQSIPIKFQLGGNQGLNVLATGFPQVQQVSCDTGAPINTATETTTAGGSGLQFDPTTNTYTYVWKTPRAASGTCVVFILGLNDGTVHTANFQFA